MPDLVTNRLSFSPESGRTDRFAFRGCQRRQPIQEFRYVDESLRADAKREAVAEIPARRGMVADATCALTESGAVGMTSHGCQAAPSLWPAFAFDYPHWSRDRAQAGPRALAATSRRETP